MQWYTKPTPTKSAFTRYSLTWRMHSREFGPIISSLCYIRHTWSSTHINPRFPSRSCLPGPRRRACIQYLSSRKWDPQGSPLSGTLFILAINNITSIIPFPLRTILFADDLSIHFQSSKNERARRRHQRPFLWSTSGYLDTALEFPFPRPII